MSHEERDFERVGDRVAFKGRIVEVHIETYKYADGSTAEREVARTSDAAAVVAVDDEHVWLVRQPREAVDDPDSLEIPAGRLDKDGESPLETAKRELAEEIGMEADRWQELTAYRSSVGLTDETVHVFLAEGVRETAHAHDSGEMERIEIVPWPLDRLGDAIEQVSDAKTLIGLLLLERRRRG
jgi:8-oxo-dGTP pyrophosphatase MutT (NUDIX family)